MSAELIAKHPALKKAIEQGDAYVEVNVLTLAIPLFQLSPTPFTAVLKKQSQSDPLYSGTMAEKPG